MTVAIVIGLVGLLCFYLEFFIPGGILALLGFLALVGSSVLFCLQIDSALLGFIYVVCLLVAAVFVCYLAIKHMKKGGGKIILISTASAKYGGGKTSLAYGVAKAGIECLTKGLAREGAPYDILVNCICPGFINTQFHTKRMKRTPEELERRAKLVPLKRAGEPIDIAGMILYLLSESGSYITGETISISGGDWL